MDKITEYRQDVTAMPIYILTKNICHKLTQNFAKMTHLYSAILPYLVHLFQKSFLTNTVKEWDLNRICKETMHLTALDKEGLMMAC